MIYQVNARGLQPYYTADRTEALKLYCYLKVYGPPCSIRAVTNARILKNSIRA